MMPVALSERKMELDQTEKAFFGSLLFSDESGLEIARAEGLKPEHFSAKYREVFKTFVAVIDRGDALDEAVAHGELIRRGVFDSEGAEAFLTECMETVPHAHHLNTYARQIALNGRLVLLRNVIRNAASEPVEDADQLLDLVSEHVDQFRDRDFVGRRELKWRRLSEVPFRDVEWLWPGFIPLGKLTILAGDPGLGKSFVSLDIAARVTTGADWPGMPNENPPASVIILACEDDPEDTIRPRFEAMGGDSSKVAIIDAVEASGKQVGFSLSDHLGELERLVQQMGDVRLVVVDPISAFCGSVDSHKNAEVRAMLGPFTDLAAEYGFAIDGINHLAKGSHKAAHAGLGSVAFTAHARAQFNFHRDETDDSARLMLPAKCNLAPDTFGLKYRLVDGQVEWSQELMTMTSDDAINLERDPDTPAVKWLRDRLSGGEEQPSKEVKAEFKEAGFTEHQFKKSRQILGIQSRKSDFDGGWQIWLP